MNAGLIAGVAAGLMALAGRLEAQLIQGEARSQADNTVPNDVLTWEDPRWWEYISIHDEPQVPFKGPGLKLGKSDYVVSGPLIDTFRVHRDRSWSDLSVLEKIESIPIVNLFVPQPMPIESRKGALKYFAWGDRNEPWANIADRPIPGPQSSLVSVGR